MMKYIDKIVIAGFVLFFGAKFLIGCGGAENGGQAPDFETELIDGSAFKLSDLEGQYVVLDFWGSWCGPCLRDMPAFMGLHAKYGDRVIFVTVALEKNDRGWKRVADQAGFSWKHQIVEKNSVILASSIARAYGVTDIPAKFIITPEGKVISGMNFEQMDQYFEASL